MGPNLRCSRQHRRLRPHPDPPDCRERGGSVRYSTRWVKNRSGHSPEAEGRKRFLRGYSVEETGYCDRGGERGDGRLQSVVQLCQRTDADGDRWKEYVDK